MAVTEFREAAAAAAAKIFTKPSDSFPQRVSAEEMKKYLTAEQAEEAGLIWQNEPPEAQKCEYCGKLLTPRGVSVGKNIIWFPFLPACSCERAEAELKAQKEAAEKAESERREAERRERMRMRISRLLGQSGIKKRFLQRTFERFICRTQKQRRCYEIAKDYADNFAEYAKRGEGLYFEGTNGTGKTHLAAAIALQLIGEGVPVVMKTSVELLADVKKTFERGGERETLNVYKKADLLIIDDLGKEQCSEWSMTTLYAILNDRYENLMPTIITTNYNAERLISALTPRTDGEKAASIISRLCESCSVVTMDWSDIRKDGG